MRPTPNIFIEMHRVSGHEHLPDTPPGSDYGLFIIGPLRIISSGTHVEDGDAVLEWEHVSVSCADRCPTWEEMCKVKQLFWTDEETVIQFHPKASVYVNRHPYCLHLWKKRGVDHETPPRECIG